MMLTTFEGSIFAAAFVAIGLTLFYFLMAAVWLLTLAAHL